MNQTNFYDCGCIEFDDGHFPMIKKMCNIHQKGYLSNGFKNSKIIKSVKSVNYP